MKKTILASSIALVSSFVLAEESVQLPQTLFENVDVFNGTENKLYEDHFVLVEGNKIASISAKAIKVRDDAVIIDGTGKTLTPALLRITPTSC